MLRSRDIEQIHKTYNCIIWKNDQNVNISSVFPNSAIFCKKRFMILTPELGFSHAYCRYVKPLYRFCEKQRHIEQKFTLSDCLGQALSRLKFVTVSDKTAEVQYKEHVELQNMFYSDPIFLQIERFMCDFQKWLNGGFESGNAVKSIKLEPFQKNILIHIIFFIAVTKLPSLANRVLSYLKYKFEIDFIGNDSVNILKQKACVFLVPRRHGKTWLTIPIICFLLRHLEGISIGYVAHQKHVSHFVMKEVEFKCRRFFPQKNITCQDNVITIEHEAFKSTALFASCYNTHSIRGQSFNLLIVDESHFIKKDAFSTILGFLPQSSTKILFISSTNSGNHSTSFLTKLSTSPFEMLSVVSYVCEDHAHMLNERENATACACYRLHKPKFICIDADVKKTADLFLEGAFKHEIMGASLCNVINDVLITEQGLIEFEFFRYSTIHKQISQFLGKELIVYIDPAYTINRRASGTGIAAIGTYLEQYIIYGMEHYFLESLLTNSDASIAECAAHMIVAILELHSFFTDVKIVIEGNSNQSSAVKIACILKQTILLSTQIHITFYHTLDQNQIAQPFYLLGREKRLAVEYFICNFNSGFIKASQEIISFTIKITYDPVEYVIEQIKNLHQINVNERITYNAKKQYFSDDLLISIIMAIYICHESKSAAFKEI
ncbi:U60 protein [macacine betaherpesvirus 9]|uniref:U60 protein n=1 Tax=macacine betaherpesvirus 9 TaxID=2560568 RepID=A0A191S3R1_9BETA|nr:U60 protein [macacine betaherpesvirus 9]ANC96514.1 U60 protein [macacine betaherpesvirus 9]